MAYVGLAGSHWATGQHAKALDSIGKALELGQRLGRDDIVSSALTMKGIFLVDRGQDGISLIEEALSLALDAHVEDQASDAYVGLHDSCIGLQRLEEAQRYFSAGMAFGERRELRVATRCVRSAQADLLLLLGKWGKAAEICNELLAIASVSPSNQLYPLRILSAIRGRRGEPGAADLLDRAAALTAGSSRRNGTRRSERCARNCSGCRASPISPAGRPGRPATRRFAAGRRS